MNTRCPRPCPLATVTGRSTPRGLVGLLWLILLASCGSPLYQPGLAARLAESPIPPQDRPDFFRVEDDIYLYRFAEGSGHDVLFLHGGPGIPTAQAPAGLKRLNGFRVTYPHERGSGRSTRPIERFASSNYYANMKELDRRLGLSVHLADIERMRRLMKQERLTLIGHSFGGFLAALYAAEFPDRVDRLVLIAPAGVLQMPPTDGGLYEQVRRHLPEGRVAAYDAYLKRFLDYGSIFEKDESRLATLNLEFYPYYLEAARNTTPSPRMEPAPDRALVGGWVVSALFFGLGRENDLRPMMDRVRARTLIIHGARDLSPPESASDYERIPNHRRVTMPESGHFPFSDHPEDFARIVHEFLTEP